VIQGVRIGGAARPAVVLVVSGLLPPLEAQRSLDLEVIVIAAAFGVGAGMESSGLASVVAGTRGVLLRLVVATVNYARLGLPLSVLVVTVLVWLVPVVWPAYRQPTTARIESAASGRQTSRSGSDGSGWL
jgi:di/tricarboxylate transporter